MTDPKTLVLAQRLYHDEQTDVATLLQGGKGAEKAVATGVSVMRADERHQVVRGGSAFGYDYQALAHHIDSKHMEPFITDWVQEVERQSP